MTEMTHPHPNDLLAFHFGESSGAERGKVEGHLRDCGECRASVALLESTALALADWPDEEPPVDGFDRVLARLGVPQPPLRRAYGLIPTLQRLAGVAAGCWVIYWGGAHLMTLPVWQRFAWLAPFRMLTGVGLAALAFFAIGSFVTLAVAPVLILELRGSERKLAT